MTCANPTCLRPFIQKTHNQKYCSSECCKVVTNEDIKRKYHEKRARLKGLVRYCANGCGTVLSRYNKYDTCAYCDSLEKAQQVQALTGLLSVISV
jgi:hypothetical protein